jgi:hypothetical protein
MPKLTAKTVEAIKPTTDRREIPDALLPGLYLIVQPSGARSWAVALPARRPDTQAHPWQLSPARSQGGTRARR